MAKSGMTMEPTKGGNFAHNNREHKIDYLVEGDFFCDKTEKEAQEYLQSLKLEAQKNYTTRTKQKMQIDLNDPKYYWSASINLNANHTLEDVRKLAQKFEEKFGWQAIQIALHRDEGKADGTRKNLHAHIEFFMVSKEGLSVFKKKDFRAKAMSEIQTFVAQELKMERGKIYKEEGEFKKHLKPAAYREHIQAIEKEQEKVSEKEKELVLEKEKSAYSFRDFQAQITALSTENTELKKELHRLNTQVKKGEADVKSLEERLTKVRELSDSWKSLYESAKAQPPKEVIVEKIIKVEDTSKIEELKKEISDLRQEKISSFKNEALKALEAKEEPEPIKDTPKEEKIDSRPVLSKIEQYNRQISELWDNKPTKLYDIEKRIDKRWTFKDCMHWFWAQGEAKKAREERFQKQRDILNKPYDDWERKLKYVEEARTKAIADEKHAQWQEEQKALKEKKAKEEQAKPQMDKQVSTKKNDIQDFNNYYAEDQGMSR